LVERFMSTDELHEHIYAPYGLLVGSDTLPSLRFRLYHLTDTMVVVDPDHLPGRLEATGLEEPLVTTRAGRLRFRARRPAGQTPR
jgi:hypothetical protein